MAESDNPRLDDAARAGWLYYIAGRTQDEIAQTLNVSRPTAQRLVSLCRSEGLITFRMHHPIADCMDLAQRLTEKFGLVHCDVVPADGSAASAFAGVAEAAAVMVERQLRSRLPVTLAFGTGRTMRASVQRVSPMNGSMHRLVSLVGNIAPDGSASPFDAVVRLAELIGAQHFPMLLPVFLASPQQRDQLVAIDAVQRIHSLAANADLWVTGVSHLSPEGPLHTDGFLSRDQLFELTRQGAVGEIAGWTFNAAGEILDQGPNLCVSSVPHQVGSDKPRICVSAGLAKMPPLHAALTGRIVNGAIVDEETARALLAL